jgi:hypothetical protein
MTVRSVNSPQNTYNQENVADSKFDRYTKCIYIYNWFVTDISFIFYFLLRNGWLFVLCTIVVLVD